MRARILLIGLVLFTSITVSVVQAQTAAVCNPTHSLTAIIDALKITDDKQEYIKSLHAARDIIDAQLDACQKGDISSAETDTTNTPSPTDTPEVTLSAAQAQQASRTAVVVAQGATRTAVFDARTSTASVQRTATAFFAQYKPILRGELVSYADQHVGEKVVVQGSVWETPNHTDLEIWISGSFDVLYIVCKEPYSGIYKNDWIKVYGTIDGFYGSFTHWPLLKDAIVVKQ